MRRSVLVFAALAVAVAAPARAALISGTLALGSPGAAVGVGSYKDPASATVLTYSGGASSDLVKIQGSLDGTNYVNVAYLSGPASSTKLVGAWRDLRTNSSSGLTGTLSYGAVAASPDIYNASVSLASGGTSSTITLAPVDLFGQGLTLALESSSSSTTDCSVEVEVSYDASKWATVVTLNGSSAWTYLADGNAPYVRGVVDAGTCGTLDAAYGTLGTPVSSVVGEIPSFTITGTTTANAATAIVGVGTKFTSEVHVGDEIALSSASSTYSTVTAITDDTHLTVASTLGNGTSQTIVDKSNSFSFVDGTGASVYGISPYTGINGDLSETVTGSADFDWSGSTGTFATPTGAVTVGGGGGAVAISSTSGVAIKATRVVPRTSSVAVPDCAGGGLTLTVAQFLDAGAATCATAQTITIPTAAGASGWVQGLASAAVGEEVDFGLYATGANALTIASADASNTLSGGTTVPANGMHVLVCKITSVTSGSETATCY